MNRIFKSILITQVFALAYTAIQAQKATDVNTPLHLSKPDYETPYGIPTEESIIGTLDKVYQYLESSTPNAVVDVESGEKITNLSKIKPAQKLAFEKGDFRPVSYEWGVTYAGMLLASQNTSDSKYAKYTLDRMELLSELFSQVLKLEEKQSDFRHPIGSILHPHALDDAGAMCAAMIKSKQYGFEGELNPMIENFIDYISNKQLRLEDGTFARNRPMKNSLWLDDLFMSVPALAYMGKYTYDNRYFDDAVKQVLQFSDRMFNQEKGLYMHAYIMDMEEHPQFHWGRANGWAIMTMIELLEVLPDDYTGRDKVLDYLQKHIYGLSHYQSGKGFWHQLIDRNDSYLETSATAIFTYSIARAINRGYVDAKAYGPMVCLAWNAVATKVNEKGQVEGTCVGTGMAFDPAFYYYRPVNIYAAHGYGPVLLAGAEMITLLKKNHPKMNDSAVQFYSEEIDTDQPIFEVK